MELNLDITDDAGRVIHEDWLLRAERVHRQLREFREAYSEALAKVFAGGGRMRVHVRNGDVVGVAVWRAFEKTDAGMQMYVDDLVTDERQRSSGVGTALLRSLVATARQLRCTRFELDSGTHRKRAHAFYFRERMAIDSYHFVMRLE